MMNALRFWLALDAPRAEMILTAAIWIGVAFIVGLNALFIVPALVHESWAWIRQALRPSRGHRIATFKARSRIDHGRAPEHTVAISERDRLNVIVRIPEQKARIL